MNQQELNKLKKKCEKRAHHSWRDAGKNIKGEHVSACCCCGLLLVEPNDRT